MIDYADTSREAYERWEDTGVSSKLDRRILSVMLRYQASGGITCERIEEILGAKHQSVSGNIRHLREKQLVRNSGNRGKTRSGRNAIKWVTTKPTPKKLPLVA